MEKCTNTGLAVSVVSRRKNGKAAEAGNRYGNRVETLLRNVSDVASYVSTLGFVCPSESLRRGEWRGVQYTGKSVRGN